MDRDYIRSIHNTQNQSPEPQAAPVKDNHTLLHQIGLDKKA